MNQILRRSLSLASAAVAVACSSAAPVGGPLEGELPAAAPPSAPSTDGGPPGPSPGDKPAPPDKCPYDGPPIDVSGFKTCGLGGRCVPSGAIPEKERSRLAPCEGGFCVPEKIIVAKGNLLPKSCASLIGGEGRCISLVFPDILAQKDRLPQDVCDPNERCAPCFDPLTGAETGACRSVSCDAPKTQAKVFGKCCEQKGVSRGRCLPKTLLPKEAADGLGNKECVDGAELCVPDEMVKQGEAFKGPPCKASTFFTGTYDGVCLSTCIERGFFGELATDRGNCAEGDFCAPCKNPLTGASTGAPGCPP